MAHNDPLIYFRVGHCPNCEYYQTCLKTLEQIGECYTEIYGSDNDADPEILEALQATPDYGPNEPNP
jgi:hypothetical protein